MRRFLPAIAALAIAAVMGFGVQAWAHLPFWLGFVIALASLLINGVVALIEDALPGGFGNPKDPKDRPSKHS